jgi:hypothetical protein
MGEEDILVGTVVTLFEASARSDLSGVILRGLLERLCVQAGWPNCTAAPVHSSLGRDAVSVRRAITPQTGTV